jgi:hypothetical protein
VRRDVFQEIGGSNEKENYKILEIEEQRIRQLFKKVRYC